MKTNRILIGASVGLIIGSLVYMSKHKKVRDLHAGIGGTWSADMRVEPIAFRSAESVLTMEELIKSGSLSIEQKKYLQAQYLSHLIINNSKNYGRIDQQTISDAVIEAVQNGVLVNQSEQ